MTNVDFLVKLRSDLMLQVHRINAEIKDKHVSTWQGLAQTGLLIDAIRQLRSEHNALTGQDLGLKAAKDHVDQFLASIHSPYLNSEPQ